MMSSPVPDKQLAPRDDQVILCDTCAKIDFERGLRDEWDEKIALGTLASIFDKQNLCSFCRLVHNAVYQAYGNEVSVTAHDGRPITCLLWNIYGGHHIKHGYRNVREVNLGIEMRGHWNAKYVGTSFVARKLATAEADCLFCARLVDRGQINFQLVKAWLQNCEQWHKSADEYSGVSQTRLAQYPRLT